jgi:hypothetical protein
VGVGARLGTGVAQRHRLGRKRRKVGWRRMRADHAWAGDGVDGIFVRISVAGVARSMGVGDPCCCVAFGLGGVRDE